jgi:hypothetical protein
LEKKTVIKRPVNKAYKRETNVADVKIKVLLVAATGLDLKKRISGSQKRMDVGPISRRARSPVARLSTTGLTYQ